MDREKFQQKALKQTKQKKSKSAEFLMGENEGVATEGITNPAFNISSINLSAYQTSEVDVIRCDKTDSTLVACQQKLKQQARSEPRGNECSRNYFDPLMDEEINPRQCGMEVSKEVPVKLYEKLLYEKLMTILDEESGMLASPEKQAEDKHDDDALDSAWPSRYNKTFHLLEEAGEVLPYIEQFEKDVQNEIILLGNSPLEQDLKQKGIFQYTKKIGRRLPKVLQSKQESQALKAAGIACQERTETKLSNLAGVNNEANEGMARGWKINWSTKPQPIQIQLKCIRGIKDKVPQGSYILKVSLHGQVGGELLSWSKVEGQQWAGTSLPVRHNGNFYDVEICFDQSLHTEVPPRKHEKPKEILLFELFLLRGTRTCIDRVVGWGAFPLYNNNFDTVNGKFKCPLLRGHYNHKIDRFQKIENLISSDLDHWLCNLYFQIIKLPRYSDEQNEYEAGLQPSSNLLVCSNIAEKNGVSKTEVTGGLQEDELNSLCLQPCHSRPFAPLQGNEAYANNSGDPDKYCNMLPVKEIHGRQCNLNLNVSQNVHGQRSPGPWQNAAETVLHSATYLEELEKHRISVCCHPAVELRTSTRLTNHLYFGVYAVFSELGRGHWYSWDFWFLILLVTMLWFVRLYLHYCSQWVYLQAIAIPVTKFQFCLYTVDLCYQNSLLHTHEELAMIVVGPLTLNAVMLLLVLMRWGCQLSFGSFPSFLSKLIMAWGLWTVLDPLAVFIVDAALGRLHYTVDKPTADSTKLYWLFLRIEGSGFPGALITILLYTVLFIISFMLLYLYFVRLHKEGCLLDMLQRIQSDEATFFVPFDLEISNQELSYIVKKAEQWRGINGERRKVVVYDYMWKNHTKKPGMSSSNISNQDEIMKSSGDSGGITVHVMIYTVHLGGYQELYRHFLRMPTGAIVETFGDISGINLVYNEVNTAIQEHISEMDNTLSTSSEIKLRERKKNTARWKGDLTGAQKS
nr:uncharacterized protein LOC132774583 [Anolis sagrei ordinatus]